MFSNIMKTKQESCLALKCKNLRTHEFAVVINSLIISSSAPRLLMKTNNQEQNVPVKWSRTGFQDPA